jgi:hypothetical protein
MQIFRQPNLGFPQNPTTLPNPNLITIAINKQQQG